MLRIAVLFVIQIVLVHDTYASYSHFNGGSVSYRVHTQPSGKEIIHLDIITGWVFGKGPCGANCSTADLHSSTQSRRQEMMKKGDPLYFGNWTAEYNINGVNRTLTRTSELNSRINSNLTEVVIAMNTKAKWEQELMKVSVEFEPTNVGTIQDIYFEGDSWHNLTMQPTNTNWHLQAKIDKRVRNDTGTPNKSPEVFVKPFYRVKLNTVTTLHIAATDPDGDIVKCKASEFSESGAISRFPLPGVTVSDAIDDCAITIDADAAKYNYTDDAWGAIAITFHDYSINTIQFGNQTIPAFVYSLGGTEAQFLIQVLENLYAPSFVSPTSPPNHHFILYAGTVWLQEMHAKSNENTTIDYFSVIGRQQENISMSAIHDGDEQHVKYVEVKWIPQDSDVGHHIICVTAVDDTGVDSDEDRCYTINVKPDRFHHNSSTASNRPYFIDLPAFEQTISCEMDVTCVLPLYIVSQVPIQAVKIIKTFFAVTEPGPISKMHHNGTEVYESDLSFRDSVDGVKQVCLRAIDVNGLESEVACVQSELLPPDPCSSTPCKNSGRCVRSDDDAAVYACHCISDSFYGKNCEKQVTDLCLSNPCQNNAKCYTIPPGVAWCSCDEVGSFVDEFCSIKTDKCHPDPCNGHGSCLDGVCNCFDRYNGTDCSNDTCPGTPAGQVVCGDISCNGDPCHGHGLCKPGGTCICSMGYRGDTNCSSASGDAGQLHQISGTRFVPPSPAPASVIQCYLKRTCHFPVYIATMVAGTAPSVKIVRSSDELSSSSVSAVSTVQYIEGIDHLYEAGVTVDGATSAGTTFLCLEAEAGHYQDEICLEIHHMRDPLELTESQEYKQKNMTYKFIDPTPNGGTNLICSKDEECILFLYTNKVTALCENVVSGDNNVNTLMAHAKGNHCVTEVSFRIPDEGNKQICFVASPQPSSQTRCYDVDVYTSGTDLCKANPCQHDGDCFHRGRDKTHCVCKDGYTGDICEKGECEAQDNTCDPGSYCFANGPSTQCICPLGMAGPKCRKRSTNTTSSSAFTDTAVPVSVTCVVNRHCTIPLGVSNKFPTRSSLEFGYVSPHVRTEGISTESSRTSSLKATVSITPTEVGEKRVCVQTHLDKSNEDEICIAVEVTSDFSVLYGFQNKPKFIAPSLPNKAELRCPADTSCHVLLHVTPGDSHDKQCTTVYFTKTPFEHNHAFSSCSSCQPGYGPKNCSIDVSMITPSSDIGQKHEVCVAVEITESHIKGEERCFNITVESAVDFGAKTGCQKIKCSNGGFCDSRDPINPVCFCSPDYSGALCGVGTPGGGSGPGSIISNFGVPYRVPCYLNIPCSVNFHMTGALSPAPIVALGYTDPSLEVTTKPTLNPLDGGNGYTGTTIVSPEEIGEHKLCLQTDNQGTVADELCTTIDVQGGSTPDVDETKPYYIDPTPAAGSTVLCNAGKTCYIELYFPSGATFNSSSVECPSIEETSPVDVAGTHLFDPVIAQSTCKSTIAYLSTSADATKTKTICTRIFVPGKAGEERCFNVSLKTDVQTTVGTGAPCKGKTCQNNGKCIADLTATPTANCVCQRGFEGDDCSTRTPTTTDLPAVINLPTGTATSPHHFVGTSAIPQEFTCIQGSYCDIPFPVSGTKLPIFGYVDPKLNAQKPTFLPSGHFVTSRIMSNSTETQRLCLQTTVDGEVNSTNVDEVCILVKMSPGPKPPVNATLPNFAKGSLTDNASVACDLNTNCHIPVYTTPVGTKCPEVRECAPGVTGVHVFETKKVNGSCVTDAVLKTSSTPSNETVCISAGPDGEERHIGVEITAFNNKKFGPCQTQHCINGGKCVADFTGGSAQGVCLCPSGQTGTTCDTAVAPSKTLPGVSPAQTTNTVTPYFVGTGAIPKDIKCYVNQPCRIPVPYHGTNPPLLGYVDPNLNYSQPTLLPDGTALTEVIPTAAGTHRLCWQTTLNGTANSKNVDEICTDVTVATGPPPVQPNPHFSAGTVPDHSTVACDTDIQCHIPFYSQPTPDGNCPDAKECPPGVTGTHVFQAKLLGGLCVTDVVYKTASTPKTDTLCISAGKPGEERHIDVEVKGFTGFGPCQKLHCENGGTCVANTTNGVCVCPDLVSGTTCETVSPCKNTYCKYGGVCREDTSDSANTKAECICINGYEGPNCDTQSPVPTDNLPAVTGNPPPSTPMTPHIDATAALLKDIVCVKDKPCQITFPFTGPKDKPPVLAPLSSNLTATNLTSLAVPGGPGTGPHTAVTTVTPKSDGPLKICIQTTVDGDENGVNVDEVCIQVKVVPTPAPTPSPTLPHFGTSTPTNGSAMTCNINIKCHLTFVTEEKSPGECAPVDQCATKLPNSFVLHTRPVGGKCVTDIIVSTGGVPKIQQLCVSSGPGGEERHYELETKDYASTDFGPCQKIHCRNGGTCDSRLGTGTCVCPLLVTGSECQNISVCRDVSCGHGKCVEMKTGGTVGHACVCERVYDGAYCNKTYNPSTTLKGVEYARGATPDAPHFDSHGAIPTEINCVANEPCKLPVPYIGHCDKPPILGYVDPDLSTAKPVVAPVGCTDPRQHTLVTTITATSTGNKKMCLQTTHNGTEQGINVDEICIQVNIKPAGTAPPPCDPTAKPCFDTTNGTNLPDWSKITCDTDTSCHHRVVTDPDPLGACSPIELCTPKLLGLSLFETKKENGKCVTDVVFRTEGSDNNNTMCLSAGPGGEQIHYSVETKPALEFGPCQKVHCVNGGKCISRDGNAKCECPHLMSGRLCQDPSPCIGAQCHHGECVEQWAGRNIVAACACQKGYEDSDNCETPSPPPTGLPGQKHPPVTVGTATPLLNEKTALPQEVVCYKDTKCDISIAYHGNTDKPPVIGHVSPSLTASKLTSTVGPDNSSHTAFTEVTPTQTGTYTVCIQTTKDGQTYGENVDEICVKVIVKRRDKAPPTPSPGQAQFHRSQAPDKSTFTCKPDISCHLEVLTVPLTNGSCSTVGQCQTHEPMQGVKVFPTTPSPSGITLPDGTTDTQLCVTNVVVRTGTMQLSEPMCLRAGPGGEHRTYTIETKQQNEFGPCQQLQCKNGGNCDAQSPTSVLCCCPAPYIGTTCEDLSNSTSVAPGTRSCDPSKATSIDTCDVKVGKDQARSLSKSGQVSCKCAVPGKPGTTVEIIKRNPAPAISGLFMPAAYGAGGMTGAMIVGIIMYVIVTKAKQPVPRVYPRQRPLRR